MKLNVLFFASGRELVGSAHTFDFLQSTELQHQNNDKTKQLMNENNPPFQLSQASKAETSVILPEKGVTVSTLVTVMKMRFPLLERLMNSSVLAVNFEYVSLESQLLLKENDEIALIPPISGG